MPIEIFSKERLNFFQDKFSKSPKNANSHPMCRRHRVSKYPAPQPHWPVLLFVPFPCRVLNLCPPAAPPHPPRPAGSARQVISSAPADSLPPVQRRAPPCQTEAVCHRPSEDRPRVTLKRRSHTPLAAGQLGRSPNGCVTQSLLRKNGGDAATRGVMKL